MKELSMQLGFAPSFDHREYRRNKQERRDDQGLTDEVAGIWQWLSCSRSMPTTYRHYDLLSCHANRKQTALHLSSEYLFFPRWWPIFTVCADPEIIRVLSKEAFADLFVTDVVPRSRGPGEPRCHSRYGKGWQQKYSNPPTCAIRHCSVLILRAAP